MTQAMPISEVRQKLRDLVDQAYADNDRVIVERNGKRMAALISYEEFLAVEPALMELHPGEPASSR